jgi:uncharacterized protein YggT (Ycf19 family)
MVTEPYPGLFRRRLRPVAVGTVGIDWSFLVALLVLWGATALLVRQ